MELGKIMSLLEKSEQIFSIIRNNSVVDEIEKLIRQFKSSDYGIGNKIYPTPLLGLLLLDPQKTEGQMTSHSKNLISSLAENFLSLESSKRQILIDICNQIFHLNELCIEPLKKALPHYTYSLNPYNWFQDVMDYYKIDTSKTFECRLFSLKEAEKIASIFYETPAFKYALSTLLEAKNNILQIHCEQAIIQLNENFINANPRGKTKLFGERGERKLDTFNRHIISLLCIKDSLSNLNQLIFQALTQKQLAVINRDDVIDYSLSWTESGEGIAIKYLINRGELYGIELNDLVRLNLEKYGLENTLCRIETHIWGGQFGDTIDIDARIVDKNLNAYGKLIRKLNDDKSN
jgi:hypothetical protein